MDNSFHLKLDNRIYTSYILLRQKICSLDRLISNLMAAIGNAHWPVNNILQHKLNSQCLKNMSNSYFGIDSNYHYLNSSRCCKCYILCNLRRNSGSLSSCIKYRLMRATHIPKHMPRMTARFIDICCNVDFGRLSINY